MNTHKGSSGGWVQSQMPGPNRELAFFKGRLSLMLFLTIKKTMQIKAKCETDLSIKTI